MLAAALGLGMSACGSGKKAETTHAGTTATGGHTGHEATPKPVSASDPAAERTTIARIGDTRISKATFDRTAASLTPKVASYEPRSRQACSAVRAKVEVTAPKKVNGRPPTTAQLQAQCKRESSDKVKRQALGHIFASEWIVQEAQRVGLGVSEEEAARQMDVYKHQQFASEEAFRKYLVTTGVTEGDLRFTVRTQLAEDRLRERIKHSVTKPTQDEVAAYYNAHKSKYGTPEKRDIEAIRTWTKSAIDKAKAELRRGVAFGDIAKRVSIDHPSAEHGGVTLGIVRGQQEKGLDEAIFAAKPHTLVGPLHLRKRYYIFEVNAIHQPVQTPFAQIEAAITKELAELREHQALTSFIASWRRRWTADTDCSAGYIVPKCKQYRHAAGEPPIKADPYTFD